MATGSNTNKRHSSPFDLAAIASAHDGDEGWIKPPGGVDIFRLFQDNMSFSCEDDSGWKFLTHLIDARVIPWGGCDCLAGPSAKDDERNALVSCALQIVAAEMKNHFFESTFAWFLFMVSRIEFRPIFDDFTKIFKNRIDTKIGSDGYSLLLKKFGWATFYSENLDKELSMILKKGADSHLIGFQDDCSPQKETPTSFAMYNSGTFVAWQKALQRTRKMEIFVKNELQQFPLTKAGWHEDSLLSLFQRKIHSDPGYVRHPTYKCDRCGNSGTLKVELAWCRWLDRIKQVNEPSRIFSYGNAKAEITITEPQG